MTTIINPTQVLESCFEIHCGEEQGTGFVISESKIITAYHVVADSEQGEKIHVRIKGVMIECFIEKSAQDLDICILNYPENDLTAFSLESTIIRIRENCETHGYPFKAGALFMSFNGRINQPIIDDISDYIISDIDIDKNFDYEGLSGAPVFINGNVAGIILRQIDDRLSFISIHKVFDFLNENNIEVNVNIPDYDTPNEFKNQLSSSCPNYGVIARLDAALEKDKNWFLIQGSPGSGKSTISASYNPKRKDIIIIGRYFLKIPNDTESVSLRTSKNYFLEYLENLISTILTGHRMPKDEKTFEQRLLRLSVLFQDLGSYYQKKSQVGLLIIDGLDEITFLDEFLNILPTQLVPELKVLLSCTSLQILPSEYKQCLSDDQIINVTPLEFSQCEEFILHELGRETIIIAAMQELAQKSEGHPLYLRYLVNFLKNSPVDFLNTEFEQWLKDIPAIQGDITKYYNSIWEKFYESPDKLWIIIIFSQVRQPITKIETYGILPENYKLTFSSHFDSIKYLLYGEEYLEIYHNSFKLYIADKTSENIELANDFIVKYLQNNKTSELSFNNLLYHYSKSSNKHFALEECNQDWADNCAKNDVAPDLVLSDIKQIISLSIDLEETTETLRLLLLLQRIDFRYDSVFTENARYMALAMISVENYKAAIKYLVRDYTLLVGNDDAIFFLQSFYENEAFFEAEILYNAIEKRYRKTVEEGSQSEDGMSLEIFSVMMKAHTLSMNANPREGLLKCMSLIKMLGNVQNRAEDSGDTMASQAFYKIRENSTSWMHSYTLRRFNFFENSEKTSSISKLEIDNEWVYMRSLSSLFFDELNSYNTKKVEKKENFNLLITDIEYLINSYGYNDENLDTLIDSLIHDSKNDSLLKELIVKKIESFPDTFSLRRENGVDPDYNAVYDLLFDYKCIGYNDEENKYPAQIQVYDRFKNWENYITGVLKKLGFIKGKILFLKCTDQNYQICIEELLQVCKDVNFSLEERKYWDRSYHLPEKILPIIYSNIFEIIIEFASDKLEEIISSVKSKLDGQLGLYSEGFRRCLYEICKLLVEANLITSLFDITAIWEIHTLRSVQNRWERTPELLKIMEIYGLAGNYGKANEIFSEILKTSMGPSWYKEDQVALINRTLSLKNDNPSLLTSFKNFAALLDYASGEMTFKRYVRNSKENFISSLIQNDQLNKALDYFKFETIPPAGQVIKNAEYDTIDSSQTGQGYTLGANNITEENAIHQIIDSADVKSPYLVWALSEIFIVNTDVFRYINKYSNIQANVLQTLKTISDNKILHLLKSVVEIALNEKINSERVNYLGSIFSSLNNENKVELQQLLKLKDVDWKINLDENEEEKLSEIKQDSFSPFIEDYEKFHKTQSKRTILIEQGITAFNSAKLTVWRSNYSSTSRESRKILKELFKSDKEAVLRLRSFIESYDDIPWEVASQLIWFLDKKLSTSQIEELYHITSEHFYELIRPTSEIVEKYNWMENEIPNLGTNDEKIGSFLIWLLNHPIDRISERTFHSIIRLGETDPELIIPLLIESSLSNRVEESTERSSFILLRLAETQQSLIEISLQNLGYDTFTEIKHFTIRYNFYKIALILKDSKYPNLYEKFITSIPASLPKTNEVDLEFDYLEFIEFELSSLNDMNILDKDFCEVLISTIKICVAPLTIEEFQKSDYYIKRSFYESVNGLERFEYILKYALNIAINSKVSFLNMDTVYDNVNL